MASFLYRLGRLAFRRRWLVAGLWVAVLMAALAGAATLSGATLILYTKNSAPPESAIATNANRRTEGQAATRERPAQALAWKS